MLTKTPTKDELRTLFVGLGFGAVDNAYFGQPGLLVFEKLPPTPDGVIQVLERSAFVYPSDGEWVVRVTPHGGPHWVRRANNAEDVRLYALEVLLSRDHRWIPSGGWTKTE
jgi:hypothetical protein